MMPENRLKRPRDPAQLAKLMVDITNGFSKKVENHAHSMALFMAYYNFVRIHKTLRTTPAMAAGITKRLWEMSDVIDVLEAYENGMQR